MRWLDLYVRRRGLLALVRWLACLTPVGPQSATHLEQAQHLCELRLVWPEDRRAGGVLADPVVRGDLLVHRGQAARGLASPTHKTHAGKRYPDSPRKQVHYGERNIEIARQ